MNKYLPILVAILLLTSCSGSKSDRDKAKNQYQTALNDSITAAEADIRDCNDRISILNEEVAGFLQNFAVVDNSNEVESYYILNGWQSKYPLTSTGIVTRIAKNEQLELIAALKGGTFNRIEVVSDKSSLSSDIVPHDQALNYRREGLNTVMFSGNKADSLVMLIADNSQSPVKINFIEGSSIKGSWQISDDYKRMILSTWQLYSSRREQMRLEYKVKMLNEKINLLRSHLLKISDSDTSTEAAE